MAATDDIAPRVTGPGTGAPAGGTVIGPYKPDMSLDQWWCAAPCGTANRSFRIRCRTCGAPELPKAARSALYSIPAQHQ